MEDGKNTYGISADCLCSLGKFGKLMTKASLFHALRNGFVRMHRRMANLSSTNQWKSLFYTDTEQLSSK